MKQSAATLTYGGLVGAVALAGASQAYGTIVSITPPTNITGNAPNTAASTKEFFDVDTGTTSTSRTSASDLEFGYLNSSTYNELFTGVYGFNGGKAAAYQYKSGYSAYAYAAGKGSQIGGTASAFKFNQYAGRFTFLVLYANGSSYNSIQQFNQLTYLGFQFKAADGLIHDGWLELETEPYVSASNPGGLIFLGGAYNTVSDASGGYINAGLLTGGSAVPEPGTLSALALGAAALTGVGLKRRRKAALAAA